MLPLRSLPVLGLSLLALTILPSAAAAAAVPDTTSLDGTRLVIDTAPVGTPLNRSISVYFQAAAGLDPDRWIINEFNSAAVLPAIDASAATNCAFTGIGADLEREMTCEVAAGGLEIYAGDGDDQVTAGGVSQNLILHGEGGADSLYGGSGVDALYGDAGDDSLSGGAGLDQFDGGAGSFDLIDYHSETRIAGVASTLNGAADDADGENVGGSPSSIGIEGLVGTDLGDSLVGDGGSNIIVGMGGADSIGGGGGSDELRGDFSNRGNYFGGAEAADTIDGGAGNDSLYGEGGNDALTARDSESDTAVNCGTDGGGTATVDAEATDAVVHNCTTVNRPDLPRLGLDDIAGVINDTLTWGAPVVTTKKNTMPNYSPRRLTVDQVQHDLGVVRQLNVQYKVHPSALSALPAARRANPKPYEVFATKPLAGKALVSKFPAPAQVIELSYYEPKIPPKEACPYANGKVDTPKGKVDMWAIVRGKGVFDGADVLDDLKCNYEITGVDYVRTVDEATLYKFTASTVKGKKLLKVRIGAPKQADFRASFNQPINPGYEKELGLADSGSIVAADQTHSTGVTVIERATGRLVQYLPVKLLSPDGDVIASGKTDAGGFVHLQYSFKQRSGQLRLVMEHIEPRTNDVLMSAVQTFTIVDRPQGWVDMNGNRMTRDLSDPKLLRFKRNGTVRAKIRAGRAATAAATNDLYEPLLRSLEESLTVVFNLQLGGGGRDIAKGVVEGIREAIKLKSTEAIARETGFSVQILGNSTAPLATSGALANGYSYPAMKILAPNGSAINAVSGGGIISGGAGNIISGGAGNIISGGAGNIISGGAGNIISGGGGNIISGGAGNIISGGAGNIISGGAGNFKKKVLPFLPRALAFRSTRYVADTRSFKVREMGDTTVIANLDGTIPATTLIAEGIGATPITLPGKLN